MILNKILENCAQKYSEKSSLKMRMGFRTKTLSYKEVYELAKKVSLFLHENGVNKGDKVLVCATNSPYWVCIYWGCLLSGTIVVPLNIQTSKQVIDKIADQTESKIIFKHLFFRHELSSKLKQFYIEYLEDLIQDFNINNFQAIEIFKEDLVQIMYTSGTTGDPKGVMLTHENLSSNLQAISKIIKVNLNNDRILSILPLSHIYEQTIGFLLPYSKGVEIVYTHSYAAIKQLINENDITKMIAVPEFLQLMMGRIEAEVQLKHRIKLLNKLRKISLKINRKFIARLLFYPILKSLGKINTIASGGAPLDADLEAKWLAMGIDILQGYGLTETSPVVSSNVPGDIKIGSVGKPIPGVQVKIADDKEILVRGPNVFMGYYKNPEKTKEAFVDGWFKTGDLGEFDSEGYLFIKGRKKYMIKGPGGQNVYPEDIEIELNKIPGVIDSCVLGFEKKSGLEVHAVMLLDSSKALNPEEIVHQVNNNLSTYQHINSWTVWSDIDFPRTPTRKIKKEEVRKYLECNMANDMQISDEKKSRLMQILSHITSVDIHKINNQTKIVPDLQLDSLRRVELVAWIEEDLNSVIEESEITPKTTVKDLEELIKNKKSIKANKNLRKWTRSKLLLPIKYILQGVAYLITRFFVKIKVEGIENLNNLPLPAIFMPNHNSYLDPLIVHMALPRKIRSKISYAAARDVLYDMYKYTSYLIEIAFNSFAIQRGQEENIKQGLDNIGQMLDEGYSVVLFPEGRMSESGKLQNLRRGAGLIATEMDAYVVPIKIIGSNNIIPYDKAFFVRRGTVTIKFGKPIKFKHSDSYAIAIEEIHKAMQDL